MIIFKTITIKNFLSFGNSPITIDLCSTKKTLVVGKNGSGKTTIPQAICYALFNKTYRKVNLSQLVNSINQKDCVVELTFSINNDNYRIIRGQKPTLFELYKNDTLITSDKDYQKTLENIILKTDYNTFSSVVTIGGKNYTTFMNLKKGDRRKIIESLLDIDIFSVMNVVTKLSIVDLNEQVKEHQIIINQLNSEIKILNDIIQNQTKNHKELQEQHDNKINKLLYNLKELDDKITITTVKKQQLSDSIGCDVDSLYNTFITHYNTLYSLISNKDNILNELYNKKKFYQTNSLCPVCSQSLTDIFKEDRITAIEVNIEKKIKYYNDNEYKLKELKQTLQQLEGERKQLKELKDILYNYNNDKNRITNLITELNNSFNNTIEKTYNITQYNDSLSDKKMQLSASLSKKETVKEELMYYEFCHNLLKDEGIKTLIIKEYLPIINQLINKYLKQMELFIDFSFDENFDEVIQSHNKTTFSYESFSDGQKLKIDLALLFTWREISCLKNSLQMNLLFLDEMFDSSLDTQNTELAIQTLKLFVNDSSNIFIISHKLDLFSDSVDRILSCSNVNNFTSIKEIN